MGKLSFGEELLELLSLMSCAAMAELKPLTSLVAGLQRSSCSPETLEDIWLDFVSTRCFSVFCYG